MDFLDVWIDGKKIRDGGGSSGGSLTAGSSGSDIDPQTVGTHRLKVRVRSRIGPGDLGAANAPVHFDKVSELTADFDVVETAPAIALLDKPDTATVATYFGTSGFVATSHMGMKDGQFSGSIDVSRSPVNLAFDVFVRTDGVEYKTGTLCVAKDSGRWGTSVFFQGANRRMPKVDIILRSSTVAARGTIDMTEIWKGEIVIKDVVVK